ncbi:MAG: DUF4271 domain-containing protein [Chitinophagaceae bacterium]|nr:DUF4271 domain-containing protein [Chitinophagaceae bacterium]
MSRFFTLITALLLWSGILTAKVNVLSYDSSIVVNTTAINKAAITATDSMLRANPMLSPDRFTAREQMRLFYDNTFDFYLVLVLVLLFGIMRFANPRYFQYLLRAFRSPSFSSQQLKDQIGNSGLPNLLMNVFFAASAGVYVYFIFKLNLPQRYAIYSPSLLITILILSFLGLYGAKYAVMRFSGWAFNVRVIISHYMYNVFLINKIISIILLPFIVLLAFAQPAIALPAMIVSLFLVGVLFVNRYIRSWQVLGSFFQYSKFHFFAYLCASELLPMALLTKLLIRGMYY